jgi:hypothetical protein
MSVSADFSTRLTAAVAHAPASGGLTTFKTDVTTVATDIAALVPQTPIVTQVAMEDLLIALASRVADELRTVN